MRVSPILALMVILVTMTGASACHVIIKKDVVGRDSMDTEFEFSYKFNGYSKDPFNLGDDDVIGLYHGTGTYSVTEDVPEGWFLTVECTGIDSSSTSYIFDPDTNALEINLQENQVTCTFTNTPQNDIPEFPTMALPVIGLLAILAIMNRRRQ